MKCPFCKGADSQVLESRQLEDGNSIRRRRECEECSKRFTTHESVRDGFLWVVKKDGRRELFDRNKLKKGISRAVEKRSVTNEKVEEFIDSIEREMLKKQKEEVDSILIGKAVLRRLNRLDKVAWLRFASVYLEFEDLTDFQKAIKERKTKKGKNNNAKTRKRKG